MRISIRVKLAGLFLVIFITMAAMIFLAVREYKKSYIDEIGTISELLAEEMFKRMDQRLFHLIGQFQIQTRVDSFQEFLSLSNNALHRIPNVKEYISEQDKQWVSVPKATITPFMTGLIDNALARSLRETFIEGSKRQYGYTLIQEIIVTNACGANMAISAKTSDYDQGDEIWWQKARDEGMFVSDIKYDSSAGGYGVDLAVRINDGSGQFAGVFLAGLNVRGLIREAEVGTRKYNTSEVHIITSDGKLIYSTVPHKFMDDFTHSALYQNLTEYKGYFLLGGDRPRIVSYAHSRGFNYFRGFDWFLVITHQIDEVLYPFQNLQRKFIIISGLLFLLIIASIVITGRTIIVPLTKLTQWVGRLSDGEPYRPVVLKANDELSDLAETFNDMFQKRQKAQQELKESESFIKSVMDNLPIGIAVNSIDPAVRFQYINDNFVRFYKITREDLVESDAFWTAVYEDPEFREKIRKQVLDDCASGDPKRMHWVDIPITRKREETVYITAHNIPIPDRQLVISTVWDVTVRKRAEDEIRRLNRDLELRIQQRTVQLEETNKELEDFVYSVSHDLRAPLRSIGGFAEIIERRHKASLNEEGQHYFENIVTASKQMGALIDDLLAFSRLGRRTFKVNNVPLGKVFTTVLEMLSSQIKETSAQIDIPEQLPSIQGDLTLAIHIFMNLFENSLKYHKPDSSPQISVGVAPGDHRVVVSVADKGIGIEKEYHEKIFNIFQRLHSQADYPGTGIGLSTVKKAVQMMGGRVWIESEPGEGSVFKVELSTATIS